MSDVSREEIMEFQLAFIKSLVGLTEAEAMNIYRAMARQFGWAGTFFTREDAETEWHSQTWRDDHADPLPLPDEVWEAIQDTWEWRKGLTEILSDRGWDLVSRAVKRVLEEEE